MEKEVFHFLFTFINRTFLSLFENRLFSTYFFYCSIVTKSCFIWGWEFMVENINDSYLVLNAKSFFLIAAHTVMRADLDKLVLLF